MIDAPELLNYLQNEQSRAVDTDLIAERATAISFYRGEPFGDEVEGRSKLRTRDVAEVIDYMTVSVMRTMVSGDRIVEFEPSEPGQEQVAQEATDRIHWNFMREQDGFRILHDGVKAGLLEKSGVWKTWVEIPQVPVIERLNAAEIDARDDVVDAVEVEGLFDLDELGNPLQVYDATIMVDGEPIFRDRAVANEQFFVAPDARDLETAAYVGDESRQSLSALADMGYPWEVLENLWGDSDSAGQPLRDARDEGRSYRDEDDSRRDYNRVVTLREEYVRWFWQGRYQLVRVHRVGNTILGVEPALMQPYVLWTPFPMPHRLIGQSLADKVLDIQVVRSHMLRQAMDNLYMSNAPRTFVPEDGMTVNTIDDLLDVAPGGIVRGKSSAPPVPWTVPFVAGNAFEAMEIMAGEKESRTGITRLNQGLDADTLNKTATGTALMQAQGQQIEESIARQVANAVGELFEKKLRLMIELMQPHQFKIDGETREIVPQDWPENMRLAVRVGLGTGNRDKRLQGIMLLRQAMAEADAAGLVGKEQVFNACKLLVSNLGFGTATQFFLDPAAQQGEEEREEVDPALQAKMMELQAKQQQQAMDLEFKREAKQLDMELKVWERTLEIELAAAKTAEEAQIARERIYAEMEMQLRNIAAKAATDAFPRFRPGGRLDV